jgi:RNA-directed DNA polymerase
MLANLYLHAFDTAWRAQGLEQRLQARLIRYADDFVILCRQTAAQVQPLVTQQLQALGLTLNPAKTRVLDARQQAFTFLGFTVRMARSWRRGTWFPLTQPSRAACQELREAVKALTGRDRARHLTATVVAEINRVVQGWGGYFYFRHCTATFRTLNQFVGDRLRIYLRRKHRYRTNGYRPFPDAVLYGRYGLYRLPLTAPWKAPASA